jgi:hypothetical protein
VSATPYLDASVPAVALFNNTESFYPYLARANQPELFATMFDKGNRALLWLGAKKLVVLSAPAPHVAYLRQRVGFSDTELLVVPEPSAWMCQDILRSPALLERVAAYAGPDRRLQLIPYTTTPGVYELADALSQSFGLSVDLPESPARENLWVRDYLDTKAGFRDVVGSLLRKAALPEGFVCDRLSVAAEAVFWLCRQRQPAIVKASRGNGGFGHWYVSPDAVPSASAALASLAANPYFEEDLLIVEQRVESPDNVFPAVELYVPPEGAPFVTHVCQELFLHGKVTGQIVTPGLAQTSWYADLVQAGLRIAGRFQALGFQGLFDVDGVVDADGGLYLLETNTRRTAGTHAHEFANLAFGEDYARHMTVICHNTLDAGRVGSSEQLLALLEDLLYTAAGAPEGIVITHTAGLREGQFGCLVFADSLDAGLGLQDEMLRRVAAA